MQERYAPNHEGSRGMAGLQGTKRNGAPLKVRTVLAHEMTRRRLTVLDICSVLHISDRRFRYCLTRDMPVPMNHFAKLCDLLDMDENELVDEHNYLREGTD